MDIQWYNEVKDLPLRDQWDRLYQRKIKIRPDNYTSLWGKSSSESMKNSKGLRDGLPDLFEKLDINKFTDCGCGDFLWMSQIDFTVVDYLGCDIVDDLIKRNKKKFPEFRFKQLNVVEEKPRKSDMIFLRSVFIHLTLEQCLKAIENIKASNSRYLMASTLTELDVNFETSCLMKKNRNLMIAPFNFPEPLILVKQRNDIENDQYMGVWKIDEL